MAVNDIAVVKYYENEDEDEDEDVNGDDLTAWIIHSTHGE